MSKVYYNGSFKEYEINELTFEDVMALREAIKTARLPVKRRLHSLAVKLDLEYNDSRTMPVSMFLSKYCNKQNIRTRAYTALVLLDCKIVADIEKLMRTDLAKVTGVGKTFKAIVGGMKELGLWK